MIARKTISKNVFTVIVEGNIGSGKSTFLNFIQKKFADVVKVFTEPLNEWRDVRGHNLFELLYENPRKWNLPFQMYADLSRFEIHESNGDCEGKIKLMERSLFSSRHCFVENSYQKKLLNDVEYVIINEFFECFVQSGQVKADCIIYLRTTPEKCMERIQLRNRKEEKHISLDYLKSLHDLHDKWLLENDAVVKHVNTKPLVITLDANAPLCELENIYKQCFFIFEKHNI